MRWKLFLSVVSIVFGVALIIRTIIFVIWKSKRSTPTEGRWTCCDENGEKFFVEYEPKKFAKPKFANPFSSNNVKTQNTKKTYKKTSPAIKSCASLTKLYDSSNEKLLHWRSLTSDEIDGWYPRGAVSQSIQNLTSFVGSTCTYDPNDPNDQRRKHKNGQRYFDYNGCNYCHKSSVYISHNNECTFQTPYLNLYTDMCPKRDRSKYYSPPIDQGPLGHDACPSVSFNRSIFNWFSATPVDPTGRYDFADYTDRNFSQAVLRMARSNRAMLWMGDSTTRESFVSVFCDLKRVFGSDNVHVLRNINMGDERLAHNDSLYVGIDKYTVRIHQSAYLSADFSGSERSAVRRLLTTSSPPLQPPSSPSVGDWLGNRTIVPGVAPSADIVEFHLYFMAANTWSNITTTKVRQNVYRTKISIIMQYCNGLVMVVNTGIHCNSVEAMQQEVDEFLPYLHSLAVMSDKNNLVIFRESSAQHYNSPNGYYNKTVKPHMCVPLTHLTHERSDSSDYRNNMVRERIISSGYNISIIPFWRYTVSPFNFHKLVDVRFVKLENVDCTHFGYTQLFMQPILRGIADRVLNG